MRSKPITPIQLDHPPGQKLYATVTHNQKNNTSRIETYYIKAGKKIRHGPSILIMGEFQLSVEVFENEVQVSSHFFDGMKS